MTYITERIGSRQLAHSFIIWYWRAKRMPPILSTAGWWVGGAVSYSCVLILLRIVGNRRAPTGLIDVIISAALLVGWMLFVILSHTSEGVIEVVTMIFLGQLADSVFGLIWTGKKGSG